jgi:beta-galactosidase/beta-glucuronidase
MTPHPAPPHADRPGPLHPRPQLARRRWTDLAGTWDFAYDDAGVGIDDGWPDRADVFDRRIRVPYPPESPASGIGDPGFHPVVWYRRTFPAQRRPGERLLLHFGAVDYRASVWVNGRHAVDHEGGHTPFSADVTPLLTGGGEQVVTVRAEDLPGDLTQPRGKQDWQERPHSVWYERTTGIWQPVWLEPVPNTHIEFLRWVPDLDRGVLRVRVRVGGAVPPGLRLAVRLTLRGNVLADDVYPATADVVQRDIPLDGARIHHERRAYLWSPDYPNLADARLSLLLDDEVVDEVGSYCGLRTVGASDRHFVLNGRGYPLRMVLAQNYWPSSHLAAPDGAALRREVELVKELGFNAVRIHQKVEDPRFLGWCDRLGVLAWGEMPSALDFGPRTIRRIMSEWLEVLERDVSSPALVAWVPFNESWGVPNLENDPAQRHAVQALYHLTKAMDPTRPVVGNDGWENFVSDMIGVHDYSPSGQVLGERYGSYEAFQRTMEQVRPFYRRITLPGLVDGGQPLIVSEFGGTTYDAGREDFWNGYGAVGSADELLERYRELVTALLSSPVVAGFCYTQLTDTQQETNGLVTEARVPKVDPAAIRAVTSRSSMAVPGEALDQLRTQSQRSTGEDVRQGHG